MRLADLDASFVGDATDTGHRLLSSVEGAQGVLFQCPKCSVDCEPGEEDGRRFFRGAHYVLCWFANPRNAPKVADDREPLPGRWYFTGDTLDTLTFTGPGAYSVLILGGCAWHGFVANGDAT